MDVVIAEDNEAMGRMAAELAADCLRRAIAKRGHAAIVVATGASQFTVLGNLVTQPGVEWSKVTGFHLDEYLGLPIHHPASFRRYLQERFTSHVPLQAFYFIDGQRLPPQAECERLASLIGRHTIDVSLVGIGENGHLAFNDPPADFETTVPYLVVDLDEACRRQQWGEGWFASLEEVPHQAISMSIQQILRSRQIICSVPDQRKARAAASSLEGPVSPRVPASILQTHPQVAVFLDPPASELLEKYRVRA
jgi:glucosamine-6-phosphate deaminase